MKSMRNLSPLINDREQNIRKQMMTFFEIIPISNIKSRGTSKKKNKRSTEQIRTKYKYMQEK